MFSLCDYPIRRAPAWRMIVPHRKWLTSIRGEQIVFTGKAWRVRAKLKRLVQRRGGVCSDQVTTATTVLVRGESKAWAYGDFGLKEKKVAQLIRDGHNICLVHDFEIRKLLERGDAAGLEKLFAEAREARDRWLKSSS